MAATIKMEVPVVESTYKQLMNIAQQLRETVRQARQQVQSTVHSAWEGKSAAQFEERFTQWSTQAERTLDQMDELLRAMRQEIDEWIRMAESLS